VALVTELLPERAQALLRSVREVDVGEPQQVIASITAMLASSSSGSGDLISLGNFALGSFEGHTRGCVPSPWLVHVTVDTYGGHVG
jgi:hypothetical protein